MKFEVSPTYREIVKLSKVRGAGEKFLSRTLYTVGAVI